jgi:peptidase E
VFAFSGILNRPPGQKRDPAFLEYAVSLATGEGKKRVCFIPTATGDSPSAIEAVTEVFAGRGDVGLSVLTLFTQPSVPDVEALPAGYATEDGVGLHYIGTELHEAVAMRGDAQAWWVEPSPGGGYHDKPIPPRRL